MNRKISILFLLIIFVMVGIFIYNEQFSADAIKKKIVNQKDYTFKLQKENVPIEFFIKSDWIPLSSEEPLKIDEIVYTDDQTNVVLMEVMKRGEHLTFSFDTKYRLNRESGNLLVNYTINPGGGITTESSMNDILLFDKNHNKIETDGVGMGPDEMFGFDIEQGEYPAIIDGFYVKYNVFNKYSYKKIK
ncbi:hypothetical protein KD050_11985 [Psychrobacillus sp. INOP01]|uniref:hypothetical protein n=1 Tax=Psychrobacillus sp. INOP01 TaxID=2829187 RepID=UPI001BA915ED|nr:hypothetical protein [Psychrobacillus sp. INOP01]QUG40038.1 hypothetical protein KD050_11985 [Psychrobacillus sp. INOP01]